MSNSSDILQPPERFVNHSCNNNTIVRNLCDVAVRDIQVGEEITSDYSSSDSGNQSFLCACGAPNCRKFFWTNYVGASLGTPLQYSRLESSNYFLNQGAGKTDATLSFHRRRCDIRSRR